jgi:hypothetical protein
MRAPETTATLGLEEGWEGSTMGELGIPPFDVVTARDGDMTLSYLFDGDARAVLGPLADAPGGKE